MRVIASVGHHYSSYLFAINKTHLVYSDLIKSTPSASVLQSKRQTFQYRATHKGALITRQVMS